MAPLGSSTYAGEHVVLTGGTSSVGVARIRLQVGFVLNCVSAVCRRDPQLD